jgi:hypothetical protein
LFTIRYIFKTKQEYFVKNQNKTREIMDFPKFKSNDFLLKFTDEVTNDKDAEDLQEFTSNHELFGQNSELLKFNFIQNCTGWTLIIRGLLHPDNLTRKRSLYLLKRLVDHLNLDTKLWDKYFLILETVDEKQVHLVKQVFAHIFDLWSTHHAEGRVDPVDLALKNRNWF